MGSVKTEILVAWIFTLLTLIGWIIGLLFYVGTGIFLASLPFSELAARVLIIPGALFFVMMIPTILVFQRTSLMRGAANRGDVDKLKRLNSIGWAIAALFFSGVIPGIMLLIAHSPIERLSTVTAMKSGTSMEDLERISKLKSLLDSGAITKEEFESQKDVLLHRGKAQPSGAEEELRKLRTLFDSGALTAAEYEEEKKKILSRMQV